MINTEYLYCVMLSGDDYITTSFQYRSDIEGIVIFNCDVDLIDIKYASIDYTNNGSVQSYKNTDRIRFYNVQLLDQDIDRKTALIQVRGTIYDFNLETYKRDLKLDSILNENR